MKKKKIIWDEKRCRVWDEMLDKPYDGDVIRVRGKDGSE